MYFKSVRDHFAGLDVFLNHEIMALSEVNSGEHTPILESNDAESTVSKDHADESNSLEFNKSGAPCISVKQLY